MPDAKNGRIQIIDALRGFALAGIVICHMVENFMGAPPAEPFNESLNLGTVDIVLDGLIFFFLRGKFIALFSFLFGLSFFIQMDNAEKRNISYGGRFIWRLAILFIIGYVHSLFYRGDILTIYAMLGIFLIPFYRLHTRWVLGLSALLFLGLGRAVVFSLTEGNSLWGGQMTMNPDAPWLLEYYDILKNGSIWEVFKINAVNGHLDKWDFQYNFFGRGYFTFAFFLVGMYFGRSGFFKNFTERKAFTKRLIIWSSLVFVLGLVVTATAFASLGENVSFDTWTAMIGLTGVDIANTGMTFLYIGIFTVLYRKAKSQKWLAKFAPYGRMALTNYVLQSIIGTLLLYGWGFGLIGELRHIYTFGIALIIIVFQVWMSKKWLSAFKYGPLEWVWRSLTFFRSFPLRKTDVDQTT